LISVKITTARTTRIIFVRWCRSEFPHHVRQYFNTLKHFFSLLSEFRAFRRFITFPYWTSAFQSGWRRSLGLAEIGTGLLGLTVPVTGLCSLGRFGLEIFRSDYEILHVHFLCKLTLINERFSTKTLQTLSKIQQLISINMWFSFSLASKFKHYTGIQDFWGLEVCNWFRRWRWVQKSFPILSIWPGLAATGHTFCSFSQNIEKLHQKFQKSTPTIFNLKTDFLITAGAFKCWNALSAVVELRRPTGSELVVACYKR